MLWLHLCGPTVDRLRRSTVGSGTREDVVTACEMSVLHEVVYIAPVPAVIAAPALAVIAAFAPLVEYFAPACAVLTHCLQVAAQSGVQHVESGHEAVCEQREWLAHLPGRLRAIESSVAAVSNSVGQQQEAGIDARLKTVEVFLANANPPLDTTSAQEEEKQDLIYAASLHQKSDRRSSQWKAVWRTWKTRFRTWTPRRRCWMRNCTRGCSPWRHRSPRCSIRPRAWLRDDGLRFRASTAVHSERGSRRARVVLQCASPVADHRELDGRDPRALREHVYFSAEERGQQV